MPEKKRKRGRPRKAQPVALPVMEATVATETAEQPSTNLLGNLKAGISNIVSHPQNPSADSSPESLPISQTPTDTAERERELAAIPDVVGGDPQVDQAKPEERKPEQPIAIPSFVATIRIPVEPMVERLFLSIAEKHGEHWKLTKAEADDIARPLQALTQRGIGWVMSLLPQGAQETAEKLPESMQLLVAVVAVCAPRLLTQLMTAPAPEQKPQLVSRPARTGGHGNQRGGIHASAEEYEEGGDL